MSWLKSFGSAIATAAKSVVHFLGSPAVQTAEQQVATVAELLLPQDAPAIQGFQSLMGKIFKQAVVTETQFANISSAGPQKLAAVVAAVGPEFQTWIQNGFPGSAALDAKVQQGLLEQASNLVVALQNAITAPPAPPAA